MEASERVSRQRRVMGLSLVGALSRLLYLTRSLLSRMDPGARLGLGGGARACRLDSFFGFLVLPGLVDLIRFAVFAKNRTSGRHRLSPPGFV